MNHSAPQKADGVAAAIRALPRWVKALLLAVSLVYVAMPWHLVPIIGQIDLAAVAWFAWQNWKGLCRTAEVPAAPARSVKEVEDARHV